MKYIILKEVALGMLLTGYFFNVAYASGNDIAATTGIIRGRAPLVNAPSKMANNTPIFTANSVDITSSRVSSNQAPKVGDTLTLKFVVVDEDLDEDKGGKQTRQTVKFGYKDKTSGTFVWSDSGITFDNQNPDLSSGTVNWKIPAAAEGSLLAYRIQPNTPYGNPSKFDKVVVGYVHLTTAPGLFDENSSSEPSVNDGTGGTAVGNGGVVRGLEDGAQIKIYRAKNDNGTFTIGEELGNGIPKVLEYFTVKVMSEDNTDITGYFNYKWSLVNQDVNAIGATTPAQDDVVDLLSINTTMDQQGPTINGIVYQIPVNGNLKIKNNSVVQLRYAGAQGYYLSVDATYNDTAVIRTSATTTQLDDSPELIRRLLSD